MYRRSFECLCIALCFLGVRCQRGWGSIGGYNSGYSNSWNSRFPSGNSGNNGGPNMQNPFDNVIENSFNNKKPSRGGSNGAGSWGSNSMNFNRVPSEGLHSSEEGKTSNWGYETASSAGKQNGGSTGNWQSDVINERPNKGMPSSNTGSLSPSKWSANSDKLPSSANNNAGFSWESGKPFEANKGQSSRPGISNAISSNNLNDNINNDENDSDYEDNSVVSSWNSNNKKTPNPISNSFAGPGKWETTTERRNKNTGASKWESNYYSKPERPLGSSNSNTSSKPGKNKTPTNSNQQTEAKPSSLDTSILDELDKNDWYFGKESDYPKPPFRSTLNIDVSELWNVDNNKKKFKPNQNSRGSGNNSKNERRNRQIPRSGDVTEGIRCECVSVNSCEEKDMIITKEDIKSDFRSLEEFRCEDLAEVCCTNPKTPVKSRANFTEEKVTLRCGERRIQENNPFGRFGANIAQPGEFPWMLTLENTRDSCGASLIHHKLALTAAHCITGALPNELVLKAGAWNSNAEAPQTRRVTRIIPHPDYNGQIPRNDIALLIVEEPFELTENVNSVCLPVTNDKWDSSQCVVAGWRPEEIGGQVIKVLEKGTVNFLPQAECQNIMLVTDLWRNYVLHDSFVCGLEKTGRQSCTGDDGGFLICPSTKHPNSYLQIGVVSKGMNCDNFGRPGIFTNVLKFLDWINRNYFELGLFDDIDIRSLE